MRLAVIAAVLAISTAASAQPGLTPPQYQDPVPPAPFAYPAPEATPVKSEGVATMLSIGATAAGFALISAGANNENGGAMALGVGALMIGPSAGHIYAGENSHAVKMSLLRGGSFVVFMAGVLQLTTASVDSECIDWCGPSNDERTKGERMMWVGGLTFVAATVYDILDASRAARRRNNKNRGYVMMPMMVQSSAGPAPAVGMSGRF
jgi:hypothetical protein